MLFLWRDRKYRIMKDRRDADEFIRAYGVDALERALANAKACEKGSREERHWSRIAKVIKQRR